MARTFTVKGRIEAEDRASGTVAKVEGAFKSLTDFLTGRFVVSAGDVEKIVEKVVQAFGAMINAAAENEQAIADLDAALGNAGDGAGTFRAALLEQADAIQAVTTFSDEAVIRAQALFATFGVAPEKIGKATQAAVDLAAALGVDLQTAATQVAGTFNGVTRGLEKVVPGIRDLTDEALAAGGAVDLLADRLSGRAISAAETFSGRLGILKNALGEVQEAVGETVTESQDIAEAFQVATGAALGFAETIRLIQPAIQFTLSALNPLSNTLHEITLAMRAAAVVAPEFGLQTRAAAEESASSLEGLLTVVQNVGLAYGSIVDTVRLVAAELDGSAAAAERAARINRELGESISQVAAIGREFGIDLESNLNAQLEVNAIKVRTLEAAYREGAVTLRDYQVISAALAAQQAKITDALDGTTKSALLADPALRAVADTIEELGNNAVEASFQVVAMTRAFDEMRASGQGAAAIQAALAAGAKLINGGTMIQFPDGSVRLVDATLRQNQSGGRFVNLDGTPRRF